MTTELSVEKINGKNICLRGVGKMFYQDGFPISIAISELKKGGVEVSILHVADECLKNGWSSKTTISKLWEDSIEPNSSYDMEVVERFCNSSYEDQREMLFECLFGCSTKEVRGGKNTEPLDWMRGVTYNINQSKI